MPKKIKTEKPKEELKETPVTKTKSKRKMRIWQWIVIGVVGAVVMAIIVFAVGIYAFKWQNKAAKAVAKIIPYPTVLMADKYFPYVHEVRLSSLWYEMSSVEKYFNEFQKLDLSKKENEDQYNKMRFQIQEQLLDNKIIGEQAKAYGVKVDQKAIDEEYKKIADANGGDAKVKEIIEKYYGWTLPQFKEKIKETLLRQELEKKFQTDDKVNTDAKKKAEDVLAQVKANPDQFAELAKKYSQDEQSAKQGGDLGKFGKGKMVPEFEKAAFALQPGQISEIVKTEYGYHIIKVESNDGNELQARHILIKTKSFNEWLSEQKKQKKIWQFYKEPKQQQTQLQPQQQQQTQQQTQQPQTQQ
jgi:parvulin-like peptidyl-prolyl isomerase